MAWLWPAYAMRHGPFLARLVFANEAWEYRVYSVIEGDKRVQIYFYCISSDNESLKKNTRLVSQSQCFTFSALQMKAYASLLFRLKVCRMIKSYYEQTMTSYHRNWIELYGSHARLPLLSWTTGWVNVWDGSASSWMDLHSAHCLLFGWSWVCWSDY